MPVRYTAFQTVLRNGETKRLAEGLLFCLLRLSNMPEISLLTEASDALLFGQQPRQWSEGQAPENSSTLTDEAKPQRQHYCYLCRLHAQNMRTSLSLLTKYLHYYHHRLEEFKKRAVFCTKVSAAKCSAERRVSHRAVSVFLIDFGRQVHFSREESARQLRHGIFSQRHCECQLVVN
jgi:hypothetical protein